MLKDKIKNKEYLTETEMDTYCHNCLDDYAIINGQYGDNPMEEINHKTKWPMNWLMKNSKKGATVTISRVKCNYTKPNEYIVQQFEYAPNRGWKIKEDYVLTERKERQNNEFFRMDRKGAWRFLPEAEAVALDAEREAACNFRLKSGCRRG
jgi:hypothetical protein